MPKKIRIPAKRADRSVRWTLEVSADTRKASADAPGTPGKRKAAAQRTTPRTSSRRPAASSPGKKPAVKRTLRRTPQPASPITPLDQIAPVRMRPTVLAMAAGAVVVVVALVFARDTSLRASAAVSGDSEVAASGDVAVVPTVVHVAPAPRVVAPVAMAPSRPPAPGAATEPPHRIEASTSPTTVPATSTAFRPVAMVARSEEPAAHAAPVDANAPSVESNLTADRVNQVPVTITGCLEVTADGDQFRLTDTEGDGAPKARGWRSGFLKKRPAAVELSELRNPAAARKYVGRRVAATGLLESRALRVRSLQSAGSVCD